MALKKTTKKINKNYRLLKHPDQTAEIQVYYAFGVEAINVPKEGYYFSLDKSMDKTIEDLKKQGFVEVK